MFLTQWQLYELGIVSFNNHGSFFKTCSLGPHMDLECPDYACMENSTCTRDVAADI